MAVIKAKPEKVVEFGIETFQKERIASRFITMANGEQFKNTLGDTVTVRLGELKTVAREYEFRTRTQPIQFDDIQGGEGLDMKIDTHLTAATHLTSEQLTLDDIAFGEDVTAPQARAIGEKADARVLAGFRNTDSAFAKLHFTAEDDPFLVALEAQRLMNEAKTAPKAGRTLFVGSNVAAAWLSSDRLSKFEGIGNDITDAVRRAVIGALAGAPVVTLDDLDPNEAFYFHRSALVGVNIVPERPQGVIATAAIRDGAWGMRQIIDYDTPYIRNRSVLHSFFGLNELKDQRDPETGELLPEADRKNARVIKLGLVGGGAVFQNRDANGVVIPDES